MQPASATHLRDSQPITSSLACITYNANFAPRDRNCKYARLICWSSLSHPLPGDQRVTAADHARSAFGLGQALRRGGQEVNPRALALELALRTRRHLSRGQTGTKLAGDRVGDENALHQGERLPHPRRIPGKHRLADAPMLQRVDRRKRLAGEEKAQSAHDLRLGRVHQHQTAGFLKVPKPAKHSLHLLRLAQLLRRRRADDHLATDMARRRHLRRGAVQPARRQREARDEVVTVRVICASIGSTFASSASSSPSPPAQLPPSEPAGPP
ncbi:hypothetical protein T492DRAFT_542864 [Pavlovales sp. CCMP2436]|nr:hypothetical protein T492DRAFT_542864 [Pavlovales sp. CCMP2436]